MTRQRGIEQNGSAVQNGCAKQNGFDKQTGFENQNGCENQNGFAMVTVIFALVALAAIVASVSALVVRGAQATALDVRQARAAQAAKAGLQWAAWQILDPRASLAPGSSNLPSCFTSPSAVTLPSPLAEYAVSVTCLRTPGESASPSFYSEDQRRLAIFQLTAVAQAGAVNAPDRVERRLEMRVESCKDPAGAAPDFRC